MLNNKNSKASHIAFGGVFSALCVVLLYFSAVFTFMDAVFWIIASVLVGICIKEFGFKVSLGVYVSSAVVCFLIVPNIFANFCYAGFFGLIPLIYNVIENRAGKFKILIIFALDLIYTIVSYYLISKFYIAFFEDVKAPILIMFVFFAVYYPAYKRLSYNIYYFINRALRPTKY